MIEESNLYNSVAPLRNVSALIALIKRVQNRAHGLPGMATYYGPSGYGKTTAAVYASNRANAIHVEARSRWTARKLCEAILIELSIKPAKTIADMIDQVSEGLALCGRPLLIDETDHLVARGLIEMVRDIYEGSGATIILIGEELLPQKLQQWERVHGRMLDWVAVEPAELADVTQLAKIYCPGVALDEGFKQHLLKMSRHSIRRICVNLERVSEFAATRGVDRVGTSDFGASGFFTGQAPAPRRIVA